MTTCIVSGQLQIAMTDKEDGNIKNESRAVRLFKAVFLLGHRRLVYSRVAHGTSVRDLDQDSTSDGTEDILITSNPDDILSFSVADCAPVCLYQPSTGTVCLLHVGWRGAVQGIILLAVQRLMKNNVQDATSMSKLHAWIGPCLRSCCNEVTRPAVQEELEDWKPFVTLKKDKAQIRLDAFIQAQLEKAGIPRENILDDGRCTYHDSTHFYSHRRATALGEAAEDGRMAVFAWKV